MPSAWAENPREANEKGGRRGVGYWSYDYE